MSLEKIISVDTIDFLNNNVIQVRTKTAIMENGVELSNSSVYHVIAPGDDYSAENAKVQAICAAVHTPEVIEAYRLAQQIQA